MNKILDIELTSGKRRGWVLSLPATDYELLDALDQLHMSPDEKPHWELLGMNIFSHLSPFLEGYSLYEINDLSRRLSSMDQGQLTAFEGLLRMACEKQEEPTMTDLFTFANSVDLCHVVAEATDDAKLGRFYAENDFLPELADLPDDVFEKLDFAKIGREMRESEKGVFTQHGYVVTHDELRPYTEPVGAIPQAPDYTFRVGLYFLDDTKKGATLELPASKERIDQAVMECGVTEWICIECRIEDSAIPDLRTARASLFDITELAQAVMDRQDRGELPKLKAVLRAVDCSDISTAIAVAENLDEYLYEPDKRSAEDIARTRLRGIVGEQDLPLLLGRVNLYDYGLDLMEAEQITMTPYGAVSPQDREMLLAPEDRPTQGGMEMQ